MGKGKKGGGGGHGNSIKNPRVYEVLYKGKKEKR